MYILSAAVAFTFLREQGYFRLLGLQLCREASCPWQCLMF